MTVLVTPAYLDAALNGEFEVLAGTTAGVHEQIVVSSFKLGRYVGAGVLSEVEVESNFLIACGQNGYIDKHNEKEALRCIRDGIRAGIASPADVVLRGDSPSVAPRESSAAHQVKQKPRLSDVPVPAWTDNKQDGRLRYAGKNAPGKMTGEIRRHQYHRDGVCVRVKIKNTNGGWVNWYRVRRQSDDRLGWQAKKPPDFVPCPYVPTSAVGLFDQSEHALLWAEGEKDADALVEAGFLAFTFGGTGDVPDVSDLLRGHDIVVAIDADAAGEIGAAKKVAAAKAAGAASIKVVRFTDLGPTGKDAADFFAAGGTKEGLIAKFEEWIKPHPPHGQETVAEKATATEAEEKADTMVVTGGAVAANVVNLADVRMKRSAEKAKSPPKPLERASSDSRPEVRLTAGNITSAVDEVEALLMTCGGIYQRANEIVTVCDAPMITSTQETITGQRIVEIGDFALAEKISSVACTTRMDARANQWINIDPTKNLVGTLRERVGKFRLPILTGVINTPTIRPDGTLLATPGYDVTTGLVYDPRGTTFPEIPLRPTRQQAEDALALLEGLLVSFPFVGPADRAVALSGILTACVRQALPTAPMHAFDAPTAGTGKSYVVDIIAAISTGREAGVMAQSRNEEEFEKRLDSELMEGSQHIAIDNCNHDLDSLKLTMMLSQLVVNVCPLGATKKVACTTNVFVTATGNNLTLVGDLTRRTVMARLDAQVERPELREFPFDPVERAKADRGKYVAAALTVVLGYKAAGAPFQVNPIASFQAWSDTVRSAIIWLGRADPASTMERVRGTDPKLDEVLVVMSEWLQVIGVNERTTVSSVIDLANQYEDHGSNFGRNAAQVNGNLREALMAIAGTGGIINPRRLGKWLIGVSDRVVNGHRFVRDGSANGRAIWKLAETVKVGGASSVTSEVSMPPKRHVPTEF